MKQKLQLILYFIDPTLFYYVIIYAITKLIEVLIGSEKNFWQSVWLKIMDICGEEEAFYLTWMLTFYTYGVYWLVGGIFLLLENKISAYKIQKKKGEVEEAGKLFKVSFKEFFSLN